MAADIRAVVLRLVQKRAKLPAQVDHDTFDFIASGHVDSVGLVTFILSLEEEFGIELSDADITSPAFRQVGSLTEMIASKRASALKRLS